MNNMQVRKDSYGDFQIEVFNANGEQQEVSFSENTPDLSGLPNGMYTIRFRQGEDTYTEDFTKQ